ncbi:hypothetical protein RSOLAG1IB_10383 [Rhizoctonia solani AG-1 IB]|uniref:Uncharacterized protein n=1 Tax=Thanatephorus cucumeris (strain AG1-IB / isolate 7/3/14) TaxID=1108050 RepID=A0A0B7FX88_THACB|nr:hypothetical protein RSOLAG1IB_10383 [Rhizoctonia solani AG-1 IB]
MERGLVTVLGGGTPHHPLSSAKERITNHVQVACVYAGTCTHVTSGVFMKCLVPSRARPTRILYRNSQIQWSQSMPANGAGYSTRPVIKLPVSMKDVIPFPQ